MNDIINTEEFPVQERTIDVITAEIMYYGDMMNATFLEVGKRLIEAKAMLQHGEWYDWLKKINIEPKTAQNCMRLTREYGSKNEIISHLGTVKALKLLALSPVERDEFLEENDAENMTGKQLAEAIAAKKKAEEEADGLREQAAERIEELGRVQEEKTEAEKKARDLEYRNEDLSMQINDLEKKIADMERADKTAATVVEPDPAVVAEKEKLKKQLEEIKKKHKAEIEEAKKKTADATAELDRHIKALESSIEQKEKKAYEKGKAESNSVEVDKLKRQLALADPSKQTFKIYFEQTQDAVRRMDNIIRELKETDGEGARKLASALAALAKMVSDTAERCME